MSAFVFEDKMLGFVLSQRSGSFLMLAALFVMIEGMLRVYSNARAGRETGSGRARPEK
ncbi:MAG: hypothetical protein OXN84_14190 [Albidovulum sp.]|nr:hypothetical protein [Albidovulum sp.]MDE0533053.1 hypothetical protein [Albidovulum sp.]